jgi:hypothetical protein
VVRCAVRCGVRMEEDGDVAEEVRRAVRWAGSQHSDSAWRLCQMEWGSDGRVWVGELRLGILYALQDHLQSLDAGK